MSLLSSGRWIVFVCAAACSRSAEPIGPDDPATTDGGRVADGPSGREPSTPGPQSPGSTGGARLKVRSITGDDGSRVPTLSMFDTLRNEECAWRATSATEQRCLPVSMFPVGSYFSDVACTRPIVGVPRSTCSPRYGYRTPSATCDSSYVSNVHVLVPYAAATFYTRVGIDNCQSAFVSSFADTLQFFDLGEAVPLTAFVAGRITDL